MQPHHRSLAGTFFFTAPLLPSEAAWSEAVVANLTVQALIDGHSLLYIQGDSVWWHHYDAAQPG